MACNRHHSYSMLLRLPAEIRQLIFVFALRSEKPLVTFRIDDYQKETYQEAVQPNLLFVNRQIRHEAISLFYSSNDFVLYAEDRQAKDAQRWLLNTQQYLDILGGVSLWLRYSTRTHLHVTPSGALSVTMHYETRQERWMVQPDVTWVTANRKPNDVNGDGDYLVAKLGSLMCSEQRQLSTDFIANVLFVLRRNYIEYKVS